MNRLTIACRRAALVAALALSVIAPLTGANAGTVPTAAPVFSNFGAANSFNNTGGTGVSVFDAEEGGRFINFVGSSFTSASAFTLTSVDVAFQHQTGGNNYTAQIQTNAGGVPSNTVLSAATFTAPASFGIVSVAFPGASLSANTAYWLVLRTTAPLNNTVGSAARNSTGANGYVTTTDGTTWSSNVTTTPVFRVNGSAVTVPEASSLALILPAFGIVGAVVVRRGVRFIKA